MYLYEYVFLLFIYLNSYLTLWLLFNKELPFFCEALVAETAGSANVLYAITTWIGKCADFDCCVGVSVGVSACTVCVHFIGNCRDSHHSGAKPQITGTLTGILPAIENSHWFGTLALIWHCGTDLALWRACYKSVCRQLSFVSFTRVSSLKILIIKCANQ